MGSQLTWLEIKSLLCPLHIEECGECDAVIFPIDHQHLVDINTDPDLVGLIWEGKLKLGIILRKANGFWKSLVTLETVAGEGREESESPQ